jgi:hypothetical protein
VGDWFQVIADVEASEAEAPALAASVIGWLRDARIIAGQPADCVLGADAGYPPGPRYVAAVTSPDEGLPGLRTNGVEVQTARTFFYPMQAALGPVTCPYCGQILELEKRSTGGPTAYWDLFSDAVEEWMACKPGVVTCPQCRRAAGINDWQWAGDYPLVVGFLGFKFWNWPPLRQSFISEVAAHLGHRVAFTGGKV